MTLPSPAMPVTLYGMRADGSLPPAPSNMEDIWVRIGNLLAHQASLLHDEQVLQATQRGVLRDGCFTMPSPYPDHPEDCCTRSWSHEYQFFYEFCSFTEERYYWVSAQLDRGYALETVWFPSRRVAVTSLPQRVDLGLFDRFEAMLAATPAKQVWDEPPCNIPRTVATGFQHMMHMLWNQLPALERLVGEPISEVAHIDVQCEPFGPTAALFPELAPFIRQTRIEDIPDLNVRHGLLIGLGSWTITPGTRLRVQRVAAEQAGPDVASKRDAFQNAHHPVIWVSVKPPKRTVANQVEMIAALITALRAGYPQAGFLLNGASLPWDYPVNSNYPPWFHEGIDGAVTRSAAIIGGIMNRLGPEMDEHVVALNDLSACDEVVWGSAASFYICHGGTMQNKIGWVHQTPGFTHSNRTFTRLFRTMPQPVVGGPPCFYASDDLIVDDDPAGYSALELARKDQNYSFTSVDAFIAEVRVALAKAGFAISS